VRAWVGDCYAEGGRPNIDPVVVFKLQLVMFFEGIRSERQLMRAVADRLSVRWYLGYGLDEPLPDHSSLTRIRTRLGLSIFQRFFERVVELCRDADLVWGKELFFDATKVRANADVDSLVPRWYAEAKVHLTDLFAADAPGADASEASGTTGSADEAAPATDEAHTDRDAAPRLPVAVPADEERRRAEENRSTWRLLEQMRLDPARPAARGYRRTTDRRVSTTDPDAAPMRAYLGERTKLGYHDHYVVDGGRARVILEALVTPADVMENAPMLDLLQCVRFRWHLHPKRAVGDTTYGTAENIRALEDAGIRAYVPLPDFDERTPYVGASRFSYDAARDEYRCPQGHPLRRVKAKYTEEMIVYQAKAATCNACPIKGRCTSSKQGRQVYRSFHAGYLDRVRAYHATPAYQKAMRKRQVWVEPLVGEAKDWHGLRRLRLRGLWKVNSEALLVAAGQHLKRWLSKTGWGPRHGPAGSLTRSPVSPSAPT
jgi:transposase